MDGISVRIFPAGDFAAPQGWPEDVGVAVVSADGLQVFPVHLRESAADILRRIAALTGIDLGTAAVHPPVAGHPACDMPFSVVADLQVAVEAFLSRTPDAVEEADDFAVNFGFAVEEGISFPALASPHDVAEPLPAPQPDAPPPGHGVLPAGASPFPCPVLRLTADGRAMVVLDPDSPILSTVAPTVFLRDDGLGLAIPRGALRGADGILNGLILPDAALPWLPAGADGDIPLIAVEREAHLLLSIRPSWAWPAPTLPPVDEVRTWRARVGALAPRGWLWPAGLATAAVLVLGMGLGGAWRGVPDPAGVAVGAPVDALRAGLFD